MFPDNETLVGIAVSTRLSPDASIAMDGWINGRRWSSYAPEQMTLKHDSTEDVIFYWDRAHKFTKEELDALNLYLERYFEDGDPRPYLCDMTRSKAYLYTGEHKED